MKKPPVALVVAAIAYLGYLVVLLLLDFTPVVAGRLAVSSVLFFFVLRGSRLAGNILAVLCGLSALVLLVAAIATISTNVSSGIVFTVVAGFLLLFAGYMIRSPSVRAFQGLTSPAAPT
mgnify:CR=1 FL=1